MQKLMRKVAILAALGLATPVWAQTAADAKDTATEKKAETRKAVRKKKKAAGESTSAVIDVRAHRR